jgi:hypothetical protein
MTTMQAMSTQPVINHQTTGRRSFSCSLFMGRQNYQHRC